MRFVCDSCRAQYMISDDKVGAKGVKVRCKKCGHDIVVRHVGATPTKEEGTGEATGAAASQDSNSEGVGLLSSLGTAPEGGLFGGVEEDEIGAVFDQVLNTGSTKVPAAEANKARALEDSGDAVRKLAEAEAGSTKPAAAHEWFVAIDEKQVGPLSMEKVKEHWDKGEVGPDSLCWRVGFGDWIPLSEATELASVLAPRPTRPVIVEPAPVASSSAMASGPVESAFSAGGLSKKSETPAPVGPSAQDSGWKPSAASVLASLVKEENDALSKPAPKASAVEEKMKPAASGLLDGLPPEPVAAPSPMRAESHAPAAQYMAPAPVPQYAPPPAQGYGAPMQQPQYAQPQGYAPPPAYPGYPPAQPPPQQGGGKMGMVVGGAVAAVLLVGAGVFFAMRTPTPPPPVVAQAPTPTQPKPAEPTPQPTPQPTVVAQQPTPTTGTPGPTAAQPATTGQPPAPVAGAAGTAVAAQTTPPTPAPTQPVKPPEPVKTEPVQVARVDPPERTGTKHPVAARPAVRGGTPAEEKEPAAAPRGTKPAGGNADDEFDELFGTKKSGGAKPSAPTGKPAVYIPDEPGGGGGATVEKLGQSDIMQVVINNKPAILRCVADQKKKDPGISGKLVMRWTIQTNGKTKAVSCQTGEFRSTYMATCIGGLIKGWTFPKHRVQGEPIDFPFTF